MGHTAWMHAVVNGVQTSLDQFRGTPYSQIDLRVSRDFHWGERTTSSPLLSFSICSIELTRATTSYLIFRLCQFRHENWTMPCTSASILPAP
jgi:hypothetical protein